MDDRPAGTVRCKRILCAGGEDNRSTCWNQETGEKIATPTGHDGDVLSAVVSSDGKHLVTASADKTLLVWELPETGKTD